MNELYSRLLTIKLTPKLTTDILESDPQIFFDKILYITLRAREKDKQTYISFIRLLSRNKLHSHNFKHITTHLDIKQ